MGIRDLSEGTTKGMWFETPAFPVEEQVLQLEKKLAEQQEYIDNLTKIGFNNRSFRNWQVALMSIAFVFLHYFIEWGHELVRQNPL